MLSEKQKRILEFPWTDYDALICDGAVRSGKTSIMALSFVLWGMSAFDGVSFAFCGKSVGAVERNIVRPLMAVQYLKDNFELNYNRALHAVIVRRNGKNNTFYMFGGKDESSYMLIQGVTLAGVLLDEVALMPRSFVEQALARCSVPGAKLWFNCNPEGPNHWFYREWILDPDARHNALHLHFLMTDNPGLDAATIARYESMYTGVFRQRYILGQWVAAEGVIYDMYTAARNTYNAETRPVDLEWSGLRTIACDYGTTNPCVYLEIYDYNDTLYIDREYRWDSREEHRQKTDAEYADDYMAYMGDKACTGIVDPSAASFIAELRSRGAYIIPANNDVLDGIRRVSVLMQAGKIRINERCTGLIGELGMYIWDVAAAQRGEERPLKTNDHATDALRYFVNSLPEWRITTQ